MIAVTTITTIGIRPISQIIDVVNQKNTPKTKIHSGQSNWPKLMSKTLIVTIMRDPIRVANKEPPINFMMMLFARFGWFGFSNFYLLRYTLKKKIATPSETVAIIMNRMMTGRGI